MAAAVLELRERASRDPLTGLGHHATFHTELPAARAATPAHRSCALLLADVDGFKDDQRHPGHAAGDEVLRAAARILRSIAPPHGRAFRIGGDEFAMVYECAGEEEARCVGWELRSRAREQLGATLSIGLAIATPVRDARAARRARRRRDVRGQAARPRRRAARSGSAGHDQRVGVGLDGHPLEPALADLAVHVELRVAAAARPRPPRRGGARPASARRSCRGAGPRRGGRARCREPAGRTVTSSAPSRGSAAPTSEPPPNAPVIGDDHLPGAAGVDDVAVDPQPARAAVTRWRPRAARRRRRRAGRARA